VFVALLEPLAEGASALIRARAGPLPPVRATSRSSCRGDVARSGRAAARGASSDLLRSIELFDVYEGPGTPAGMKSLAYALQFQHAERTLTEAEVSDLQSRMVAAVVQGCGGQLRERS
jgi:phenylalanyl-tRNA synthetase beta chain